MHRPQVPRGLTLQEIRITETFGPLRRTPSSAGDSTPHPSPRLSAPIAARNFHGPAMGSPAFRLRPGIDERQRMELREEHPAAAIDEERVRRRHRIDAEEGEGDHPAYGRGPRSAGHSAHLLVAPQDGVAAFRRHVPLDPEAEELPPDLADVRSAGDGLLADVAAFREAKR